MLPGYAAHTNYMIGHRDVAIRQHEVTEPVVDMAGILSDRLDQM
jgi:hypothetical protein